MYTQLSTQNCRLPQFKKDALDPITLPSDIECTPVHHKLHATFVERLVQAFTAAWLLATRSGASFRQDTEIGGWRTNMLETFSKEYFNTPTTDQRSIALQYILDLALFDHVKVELVGRDPEAAIRYLCVCRNFMRKDGRNRSAAHQLY